MMSQDPLTFVDTVDIGQHIVLFYGDPEYARTIEFYYILHGLLKGQHCIYTAHHRDPEFIKTSAEDHRFQSVDECRSCSQMYLSMVSAET